MKRIFKDLSKRDKQAYYKKKDELASQGKIKKKEASSAKHDRKRFIQKVLNAVDKVDKECDENVETLTTTDAEEGTSNDRMTRVMNLLNSRNVNMAKTVRPVNFRVFNVSSDQGFCNTFADNYSREKKEERWRRAGSGRTTNKKDTFQRWP